MDTTTDSLKRPLDQRPVSPALFAHFVLQTSNLPAMRDWYLTVLNARIVHENPMLCFMTYDEEHHRVALLNLPDLQTRDEKARGVHHVAYTYASLGDLLATYRRLKAKGIEPYWPINHGPTVSMYYHDPDGNSVELQVDVFASKQESAAFFDSAAFRDNPIGVAFDPEDMARQYEAGVPEPDLMRRPAGPPPALT
jgi:catechol 2,3-dioxygenase-like lactoylglutathione lyase family enzyme